MIFKIIFCMKSPLDILKINSIFPSNMCPNDNYEYDKNWIKIFFNALFIVLFFLKNLPLLRWQCWIHRQSYYFFCFQNFSDLHCKSLFCPSVLSHTCHKLQFNRKNSLHPLEAKRVQLLCILSHIENGFLFERKNSE